MQRLTVVTLHNYLLGTYIKVHFSKTFLQNYRQQESCNFNQSYILCALLYGGLLKKYYYTSVYLRSENRLHALRTKTVKVQPLNF